MTASGHIYGVVLNDQAERASLAPQFSEPPYRAPPKAPVVYMKPAVALACGPVQVMVGERLRVAATLALLIAHDATCRSAGDALECVGAVALAIDASAPQADYYRPTIGQNIRAGSLAIGDWVAPAWPSRIDTFLDGDVAHGWPTDRLYRSPPDLIADLSAFMTLRAGDILLVGLPGDAPLAGAGQIVRAEASGLPTVELRIAESL